MPTLAVFHLSRGVNKSYINIPHLQDPIYVAGDTILKFLKEINLYEKI
jgi:hypothetical protein